MRHGIKSRMEVKEYSAHLFVWNHHQVKFSWSISNPQAIYQLLYTLSTFSLHHGHQCLSHLSWQRVIDELFAIGSTLQFVCKYNIYNTLHCSCLKINRPHFRSQQCSPFCLCFLSTCRWRPKLIEACWAETVKMIRVQKFHKVLLAGDTFWECHVCPLLWNPQKRHLCECPEPSPSHLSLLYLSYRSG